MPPFDFPNSPTPGQQVTGAGNQVYTFDSVKWQASGAGLNQATADARYVNVSGDTMAGDLLLAADPTISMQAATRHYVDNAINLAGNYLGTWQVAANSPSISAGGSIANANYVAVTANPVVAETAPVGIPGIAGQSINNGDRIIWASGLAVWQILRSAGAVSGVTSFNTRAGAVTLNNTDVTTVLPASSTTPSMDGAAAVGTGTTWARADHAHPTDTSRYAASNPSGYQTAAQVTTAVAPALNDVGRNLLHNAGFTVAQRGVGPWTVSGYTLDRWTMLVITDASSVRQIALSDADRAAIGDEAARSGFQNIFTGNAATGAFHELNQMIEDVRRLAGKTVTLSFWAVASSALKLGFNATQRMGTGGSPSADVNVLTTGNSVTLSTTWTRYSTSISFPSLSGKTIGTAGNDNTMLRIAFSSGATNSAFFGNVGVQSGTINIWGVQLEIGSVATPLEKRDPEQELRQCQRFYQAGIVNFNGYGGAGGAYGAQLPFGVTMRANPVIVLANQTYINASGATVSNIAISGALFNATTTATGALVWGANYAASADL